MTANGVTIVGQPNMPSHIAVDASQLYAKNLLAFLGLSGRQGTAIARRSTAADEIVKHRADPRRSGRPESWSGPRELRPGRRVSHAKPPQTSLMCVRSFFLTVFRARRLRRLLRRLAGDAGAAFAADERHQRRLDRHHRRRADRRGPGRVSSFSKIMGFVAVTLASVNIFGGFIVTQRMLQMFQEEAEISGQAGEIL